MRVELILGGVLVVIVVSYFYYRNYLRRRAAALAGPCGLFTDWVFSDECLGLCPPGAGVCTVLTTRPYFGGLGGTQAATCGCRVPAAGGAGGGGAVAVPPGGTLPGNIAPISGSTTTGQ